MAKKYLSMLLALVMVFTLFIGATANAADTLDAFADKVDITYTAAATVLTDLDVFKGVASDDATNFDAKGTLTRAQGATLVARIKLGHDPIDAASDFSDVKAGAWPAGAVTYGAENGIINGIGGGKFDPNGKLTVMQYLKLLLAALGYGQNGEFTGASWENNVYVKALEIGLFGEVPTITEDREATREEAAEFTLMALTLPTATYSKALDIYSTHTNPIDSTSPSNGTIGDKFYLTKTLLADQLGKPINEYSVHGEVVADKDASYEYVTKTVLVSKAYANQGAFTTALFGAAETIHDASATDWYWNGVGPTPDAITDLYDGKDTATQDDDEVYAGAKATAFITRRIYENGKPYVTQVVVTREIAGKVIAVNDTKKTATIDLYFTVSNKQEVTDKVRLTNVPNENYGFKANEMLTVTVNENVITSDSVAFDWAAEVKSLGDDFVEPVFAMAAAKVAGTLGAAKNDYVAIGSDKAYYSGYNPFIARSSVSTAQASYAKVYLDANGFVFWMFIDSASNYEATDYAVVLKPAAKPDYYTGGMFDAMITGPFEVASISGLDEITEVYYGSSMTLGYETSAMVTKTWAQAVAEVNAVGVVLKKGTFIAGQSGGTWNPEMWSVASLAGDASATKFVGTGVNGYAYASKVIVMIDGTIYDENEKLYKKSDLADKKFTSAKYHLNADDMIDIVIAEGVIPPTLDETIGKATITVAGHVLNKVPVQDGDPGPLSGLPAAANKVTYQFYYGTYPTLTNLTAGDLPGAGFTRTEKAVDTSDPGSHYAIVTSNGNNYITFWTVE